MSREDVPPPYTAVTRHALFPEPSHDEAARFNFLAGLNKYLSAGIGQGNRVAYETRVLPAFRAFAQQVDDALARRVTLRLSNQGSAR